MEKTRFQPMFAARKLDRPDELRYPLLASVKIDGYRAVVKDGVAYTRKLKVITNKFVQKTIRHYHGLDGELCVGPPNHPDLIRRCGAIRRIEGEPDFRFHVFDFWDLPIGYRARLAEARRLISDSNNGRLVLLPQRVIRDAVELRVFENEALADGYEGLILRDPNGRYKHGRSTEREGYLLKLKRWVDGEMRIEGFYEEMENTNEAGTDELGRTKRSKKKEGMVGKGRLGGFIGPDLETGVEVRVGGGFKAHEREEFWKNRKRLVGEIVTYKHFEQTGVHEKRRFTIFRAFRDPNDL